VLGLLVQGLVLTTFLHLLFGSGRCTSLLFDFLPSCPMCRHFGAEPSKVLVVGSPLLLRWPLYCQTKRCHRRHAGGTEFRKRCLSLLFARAGGHVPWSSWIDGISFPICLRAFRKMPASQIGGESGPVSLNRMRVRVKQKSILCQSLCLSSRRRGSLERHK
jgi:hypothetical protein